MRLQIKRCDGAVSPGHSELVDSEQLRLIEADLERCLARFGERVRSAELHLDSDPAPPWYRCRIRVRLASGRKLAVRATATEPIAALHCAVERLARAPRRPPRRPRRFWHGWLEV